jgi:peroxiredoxin
MSSGELTNASESASEVVQRLVGCGLPSVELTAPGGYKVPVDRFTHGLGVIYFYPGSPEDRSSSAEDAALHAGFSEHNEDLAALRIRALGISTEAPDLQVERREAAMIPHDLLSDSDLSIGGALGMPTEVDGDGNTRYRRIVLVVQDGTIRRALYPIQNGPRSASQVIALLRRST